VRAFRLAYDGRPYHGFQRQPAVPTVEGTLLDALRDLGVLDGDEDTPPGYAAAGRTDAGVSAVAQTVAFECPDWCTPRALNSALPASARVWAAVDASADFHATHHARFREYTYHLYAPSSQRESAAPFSDDRAREALDGLCGRHDFYNLTPDDEGTVRELSGSLERDGDYLVVTLRAGGFARELVRRVVSLVHAVGTGDAPRSKVATVLGPDPVDGPEGVAPAPAYPLVLTDVGYDLDFSVDADAAASAREVFADRRVEWATRSRVAAEILSGIDVS